ncbi:uncharacterized protein LOC108438899 isoform X2 [Pygocentrus nattereri]|uniref:uncharacterized protein LOC108438899 isoform X2 n=1 Tax=Pygocentrus nattereri TaxID=42514 RepID=UPI000814745C|nr:uncharacterized protein LOC108438899 isoform X2 [Pygocentrus nattereri]
MFAVFTAHDSNSLCILFSEEYQIKISSTAFPLRLLNMDKNGELPKEAAPPYPGPPVNYGGVDMGIHPGYPSAQYPPTAGFPAYPGPAPQSGQPAMYQGPSPGVNPGVIPVATSDPFIRQGPAHSRNPPLRLVERRKKHNHAYRVHNYPSCAQLHLIWLRKGKKKQTCNTGT